MKESVSYRKKLKLMLWGSLALFLLCYLFAFKKTMNERKVLINNRIINTEIENSAATNSELREELSALDSDISGISSTGRETQEKIIELINTSAVNERIKLIEMPGQNSSVENGLTTNSQVFTVQGDFICLVKFVRLLEDNAIAGKTVSADFFRYTDKQSGFAATRVRLFLQNINVKSK